MLGEYCSVEIQASKSQKSELLRAAEKMLERLREHGRITPRDLYRTYALGFQKLLRSRPLRAGRPDSTERAVLGVTVSAAAADTCGQSCSR